MLKGGLVGMRGQKNSAGRMRGEMDHVNVRYNIAQRLASCEIKNSIIVTLVLR